MGTALIVSLAPDAVEAAYEQIARQIRAHIAGGGLLPGVRLPGVRGLAADLGVNLNTVARAYRLLEEQGFVRIRDRSCAEVAPPARRAAASMRAGFEEEVQELVARMRQAGISADEVRRFIDRHLEARRGQPQR